MFMHSKFSTSDSFLARVVSHKRREITRAKQLLPLAELERRTRAQAAPRDFRRALTGGENIAVIAEMKKASPSAGILRENYDPKRLAKNYSENGAAALSILTDAEFFHGHLDHLRQAHKACALPLLRKDFLLEPYQVLEARAHGADAILLIVAILDRSQLFELLSVAGELGMQALAETHNEAEIDKALLAGADIIGINNRDLQTFEVALETTERLAKLIPRSCVRVAESGITSQQDVEHMATCGMDAILIGSHLMRQPDPGKTLSTLTGVSRQ
ncbi:MAG: indole-3-glycerol phosphate synthase TrpC [bacterium]